MKDSPELRAAQEHVLAFGKHAGTSLGTLAGDEEGLGYLDWLVDQDWLNEDTKKHVIVILREYR